MRFATTSILLTCCICASIGIAQQASTAEKTAEKPIQHVRPNDAGGALPTRFDMLRGAWGPYRANNDLLYYHLDIRVDPEQQTIRGKNTIRFRMLRDGVRIQF